MTKKEIIKKINTPKDLADYTVNMMVLGEFFIKTFEISVCKKVLALEEKYFLEIKNKNFTQIEITKKDYYKIREVLKWMILMLKK